MAKLHQLQMFHRLLSGRRTPLAKAAIGQHLTCSDSTVERIIELMREEYGAPIVNVRGEGYRYDSEKPYHFPGLWLDQQEVYALAAMHQMLAQQEPCGVLREMLEPMEKILHRRLPDIAREIGRINLRGIQSRFQMLPCFADITTALLQRKRLKLHYDARSNGKHSEREISPHQLIHYRDNWFLDCFCHLRNEPRTLALDRIQQVKTLNTDASGTTLPEKERGYGIFGGQALHTATLHFTSSRARWIADEQWHPRQQGIWLDDGSYKLCIPYGNPTELILDICRYGPDVEVISPMELRQAVADKLRAAAARYD